MTINLGEALSYSAHGVCGKKRDSYPSICVCIDIPAVLQGRDFSDELYGGYREMKKSIHAL